MTYFPGPPDDADARAAKHALTEEMRALIDDVLMLDAPEAGAEALSTVTRAVAEVRERIGTLATLRGRERADWPTDELPVSERSPFAGKSNPIAAPLHLETDGVTTRGWAVYGNAYEGGPGDMHGGVVLGAFDDLLGAAQMVGDVAGRTGTMTVRFRAPSPLGERIDYEATIERVERRKVFCRGTARAGDLLLAEAEAIFVAPRRRVSPR
jgi:acyl-coenzyme A thioesterase PaaI-like protein